MEEQFQTSERRVCGLMSIAVSSFRYRSRRSDEDLKEKLARLAREKPRYGYRRLQVLIEHEGERVNHKSPRVQLTAANQEWAPDFAHDVVAAGRTIRVLSVADAFTRECLALEVDTGFASRRVTRVLDEVIGQRGLPQAIRCDNGPELTSRHFLAWGLELEDRAAAHPARPSHAERPCRELPRTAARGVPARQLVQQSLRRTLKNHGLEKGVQRNPASQQPRLQNS